MECPEAPVFQGHQLLAGCGDEDVAGIVGGQPLVRLALDELAYFTTNIEVLGVYPADAGRH